MDGKLRAAIAAAVQAYIDADDTDKARRRGPALSPWKMGARREVLSRGSLADRGNSLRVRLNRFTLR